MLLRAVRLGRFAVRYVVSEDTPQGIGVVTVGGVGKLT